MTTASCGEAKPKAVAKAKCRVCQCHEDDACLLGTPESGVPCMWVESDLCSACANVGQILLVPGGVQWLLFVLAVYVGNVDPVSEGNQTDVSSESQEG